jgi:hypothetical protein
MERTVADDKTSTSTPTQDPDLSLAVDEQGNSDPLPPEHRPGAEWVLADIGRSVDFRKEYYKYTITIATALLAFSVSFPPTLTSIGSVFLVRIAWLALGVSILCGVTAHFAWSKFFISFRNFDNRGKRKAGIQNRKTWTGTRRMVEFIQFVGLLIGVIGIALFASVNYQHVALHAPDTSILGRPTQIHP